MYKVSIETENWFIANAGPLVPDEHGIDKWDDLQRWGLESDPGFTSPMPVYAYSPADVEASLFSTRQGAMAFQAWHDRRHLQEKLDFSMESENRLAVLHVDEMLKAGLPPCDAVAVYHLIYGRNRYYWNNGHRVHGNPSEFVSEAFRDGVSHAARDQREAQ